MENELAIERTVAGGTSPTAVTFLPLITVEYTEDEPTREDSSAASSSSGASLVFVSISTKTDTEARPSLKTRWETGSVDPGITCAEPAGAFYAFPNITGTGLSSTELAARLLIERSEERRVGKECA